MICFRRGPMPQVKSGARPWLSGAVRLLCLLPDGNSPQEKREGNSVDHCGDEYTARRLSAPHLHECDVSAQNKYQESKCVHARLPALAAPPRAAPHLSLNQSTAERPRMCI